MVSPESLGPVTWFSLPEPSSQDRLIHGSSWSWTYVRTPVVMLFLVLQIVFADGSFECDNLTEWYVRLWFVDKFILNTLEIPRLPQSTNIIMIIRIHSLAIGIRSPACKCKTAGCFSTIFDPPPCTAFRRRQLRVKFVAIPSLSYPILNLYRLYSSRVCPLHIYV